MLGPTSLGIMRRSAGVPLNCGLILSNRWGPPQSVRGNSPELEVHRICRRYRGVRVLALCLLGPWLRSRAVATQGDIRHKWWDRKESIPLHGHVLGGRTWPTNTAPATRIIRPTTQERPSSDTDSTPKRNSITVMKGTGEQQTPGIWEHLGTDQPRMFQIASPRVLSSPGKMWAYVFSVVTMVAWPIRR